MITYKKLPSGNEEVHMDGQYQGTIMREFGGWRYYPSGQHEGDELMDSIRAVKDSLEAE